MPSVVYLVCVSSIACVAMGSSPGLAYISAIAWGVSLVLGGYFLNRKKLILVFGLNVLLLYGFTGSSSLFLGLVFFGFPSLIMGLLLINGKGYYELQKWGMASAVILVSLFLGLSYYQAGSAPISDMQTQIEKYVQESMDKPSDASFWKFYEDQGISREEITKNLITVARGIVMHLPAFYYLEAILAVFIILTLSVFICRKMNLPILFRKSFDKEIMPWQFAWVIIIALSLWLWGRDELSAPYYVGSNILAIAAPVTMYYGLASLAYRWVNMQSSKKKWAVIIFIIVFIMIALPAIIFIGLLGLFDSLLDYRKLRHEKEESR